MTWPQVLEYNEAIQSPHLCFEDPELKQGQVAANALGWPMPCTGNFAAVYQVTCPGNRVWAVKCFIREIAGLRQRYQAICDHLAQARKRLSLPFMIEARYRERGILVNGQWFPILQMNWVQGQTLNQFVGASLRKPNVLSALATLWVRLARDLRAAGIAHGDLQHGNVLLVQGARPSSVRPVLVDYDGMFVPALADTRSGEMGHANYQHPQRSRDNIYDGEVDRFSHLVILTALHGLLANRKLWERFDNEENLLFREDDFRSPQTSPLFQELWQLPGPAHTLAGHLILATQQPLHQVPLIEELIQEGKLLPLTPAQERHVGELLQAGRPKVRAVPKRAGPAFPEIPRSQALPGNALPRGSASRRRESRRSLENLNSQAEPENESTAARQPRPAGPALWWASPAAEVPLASDPALFPAPTAPAVFPAAVIPLAETPKPQAIQSALAQAARDLAAKYHLDMFAEAATVFFDKATAQAEKGRFLDEFPPDPSACTSAGQSSATQPARYKLFFCETCETYMEICIAKQICLGGLRLVFRALAERNFPAAAGAVLLAKNSHTSLIQLYRCLRCGRGYLSLYFHFRGMWQTRSGKDRQHEAHWLIASLPLGPQEVALFSAAAPVPVFDATS